MKKFFSQAIAAAAALLLLANSVGITMASETTCTVCSPPTGTLGYKWFTLRGNSSFTCKFGSQTITQSYAGTALAGFRPDGSIGAISFANAGVTSQTFVAQESNCQVNF